MKKIISILFVLIAAGALLPSCEDVETGFDAITKAPDPASTYFLQFINASQSKETGVTVAGTLIDVELPVAAVLMGLPQSTPITLNLAVDPSSTMTPSMYTLSATSITIPANATSGSVTFKTVAANMVPGETKTLVLTMDAGEHNSPSPTGTKLTYSVKRMEFCPLTNGVADLVGSWAGEDALYTSVITSAVDGAKLKLSGMNKGFIEDWWGEPIVAGGSCLVTVTGNGLLDIPRQYIFTTVYRGVNYDYEIKGSGKWENCGSQPRLIIEYDIYYVGDADGLAKTYGPAYLGGITFFTADVNLN